MRAEAIRLPLGVFKLKLEGMGPDEFADLVGGWDGLVKLLGGPSGFDAILTQAWKDRQHDEDARDLLYEEVKDLADTIKELNEGQQTFEDTKSWIDLLAGQVSALLDFGYRLPEGYILMQRAWSWGYIKTKEPTKLLYGRNRRGKRNHLLQFNRNVRFACTSSGLFRFNDPTVGGASEVDGIPDLCHNCLSMMKGARYDHRFLGIVKEDEVLDDQARP